MIAWPKLREGRIHMRCPSCGRKQSNMPRHNDPAEAVTLVTDCPKCADIGSDANLRYLDANGNELAAPQETE